MERVIPKYVELPLVLLGKYSILSRSLLSCAFGISLMFFDAG